MLRSLLAVTAATTPLVVEAQGTAAAGHLFLGQGFFAFLALPTVGALVLAAVLLFKSWRHCLVAVAVCAGLAVLLAVARSIGMSNVTTIVWLGALILFPMTCFIVFAVVAIFAFRSKRTHAPEGLTLAATSSDARGALAAGLSGTTVGSRTPRFPRAALVLPPLFLVGLFMLTPTLYGLALPGMEANPVPEMLVNAGWRLGHVGALAIAVWAVVRGARLLRSRAAPVTLVNIVCLAVGGLFVLFTVLSHLAYFVTRH